VNLQATRGAAAGRFFLHPGFRKARFPERKDPDTIRIFVLGGSSAYGLYVGDADAFSGRLKHLLTGRHPDRNFEVINLGCPGWASNRVLNLIGSLGDLDPDLFVVYSGHNELLQGKVDRGPDIEDSRWRLRLLKSSNLYRWIDHMVASARRGQEFQEVREDMAALEAGRSLVFDPSTLPADERLRPDPALLEDAARQYGANVRRMVELGRDTGVPVANLWSPPTVAAGDLLTREGSPQSARFLEGLQALKEARLDEAGRILGDLAESEPADAGLHYWLGVTLFRSGETETGRLELQAALDRDVRTHRINSLMEQALLGAGGDQVLDFRPVLRTTGTDAEAAELFSDHCHPTEKGHRLIADALLPNVELLLGL
jgi:lysophospholipase L1-like esterase